MPQPIPSDTPTAALAVAIAVTTAAGSSPAVPTRDLVGDLDPHMVIAALGSAWSVTLRTMLGDQGRETALRLVGLSAAAVTE